jgi:DNA replication protein DnaC
MAQKIQPGNPRSKITMELLNDMQTMTTRDCADCATGFTPHDVEFGGRTIFTQTRCEACQERACKASEDAERVRVAEAKKKAREDAFLAICPPLYRDTDPERIHARFREAAFTWTWNPVGVGFVGMAGKGKTRAAYLLMNRMVQAGHRCAAMTSTTFGKICVDQFADDKARKAQAEKDLRACYTASVWFLDDLGKQRMTERGEMELYAVLEHRTANMLPTIWTANAKSDVLCKMFSEDRGVPIMRRLIEFSRITAVWRDGQ